MKKILFVFITILLSINIVLAQQTIKVLAIGNSFSEDAVENNLAELVEAGGDHIIIGNAYRPGESLVGHYNNSVSNTANYRYTKIVNGIKTVLNNQSLKTMIEDEEWDYISFQQRSANTGQYSTYLPYLMDLITYASTHTTNSDVKFLFHVTWAYSKDSSHPEFGNYGKDQMTMYNAIIDAGKKVEQITDIEFIIPSGTAVQNGRTSSLGDTFTRDGYHLQLSYGRYTAACTWYEKLFGKSVVGNTYKPNSMSDFQQKVAQQAAHEAVKTPYSITSLAHLVNDTPIEDFTKKINISFASDSEIDSWNALTSFGNNSVIANLKDYEGVYTPVSITVYDRFNGINETGPTTTNTDMDMPTGATTKSFFGNVGEFWGKEPTGGLKFSGLDKEQSYDFSVFASRMNVSDNRETYFKFSGLTENDTTLYINASNNTTKTVKALSIKPNNSGEILIEAGAGPNNNSSVKFYYITAMNIKPSSATGVPMLQVMDDKKIDLYPNPANKTLSVKYNAPIYSVKVLSTSGETILDLKNNSNTNSTKLDISNIPAGVYFVYLNNKSGKTFLKK